MRAQDIRNNYLAFFKKQGHAVIPRALMVPYNEPSVLFTGSGMQPLIPYLLGEKHPEGTRLVDSQTCLRAQDIDDVGDNRHTTFFEMLGNWSLGDYFKAEQLPWFFEFLVDVVGLDPSKLYVTCCSGFPEFNVPKDTDSAEIWTKLFESKGIDTKQVEIGSEENGYKVGDQGGRIFFYDEKNWWSRNGAPKEVKVGEPCGPDSEVFYLFDHIEHDTKWGERCHPNCDCGRYMEIGNSVFMEYIRTEAGFEKLPKQNVDFGAGLERIAAARIDSSDMFKISLLWPIIEKLQDLSGKSYESHTESMRVIADHLRAATFLAVDGVVPSNKEQGYVMRRLMRRAILKAFDLGIEQNFMQEVVPVIADLYHDDFPEVAENRVKVIEVLAKEEKVFRQTLRKGKQTLPKIAGTTLTGQEVFTMYDTYGFPVELSVEEASILGIEISPDWQKEFEAKMQEQRERSQTAAKGTFKGGLGGHTLQHKKYHTATHLMYQALRDVLGDHVVQNGSNITEERLRFDFSHPEKVTAEQIAQVEEIVNREIAKDLKVSFAEYPTKVAREEMGALGQFGDRYGETVKVYKMIADGADKPFSFEICGGPHVDHTLQLFEDGKKFKIIKEEASSAGIRRIKAVIA
ncbi:MAG TPA: alanine--tRNA ligase [Candidatus Saccharibacteria bacterium]|jgi:alanyl-tRNA synthetase|nr:alanine--tRNA ligase [Candidatus Saccharibacteria bacterium]HMT55666.1 alanine--tRNA ligase [Candidatus Saccharibacteria bacterium]